MKISIDANFLGGTDIIVAGREAVALANRILCDVHFDFNGVHIRVCPGADPNDLPSMFRKEVNGPRPRVIVLKAPTTQEQP